MTLKIEKTYKNGKEIEPAFVIEENSDESDGSLEISTVESQDSSEHGCISSNNGERECLKPWHLFRPDQAIRGVAKRILDAIIKP